MLKNLPNPSCCNTNDIRHLCPRCAVAFNAAHQQRSYETNVLDDDDGDDFEDGDELFDDFVEEMEDGFDDEPVLQRSVATTNAANRRAANYITRNNRSMSVGDDLLLPPNTMEQIIALNAAERQTKASGRTTSTYRNEPQDDLLIPPTINYAELSKANRQ